MSGATARMIRVLTVVTLACASTTVSAQEDPFIVENDQQAQDPNEPAYVDASQGQEQVYTDPNAQQQAYGEDPQAQQGQGVERGARQISAYLTVPIWLSDADGYDPSAAGIGIGGRFGWEFGYFVPEIHIGVQTHPLANPDFSRLTNVWISGGVRFQVLNPSRFLPFVAAAVRGHFYWDVDDDQLRSDYTDVHLGVAVGGGVAVEISSTFGIEAAVDFVTSIPTNVEVLESTQFQLVPRLGATLYF